MKTRTLLALGAAAAAGLALLAWAFAPRPLAVEAAEVTQGRFETSIEEDGKTRLRERYLVSAPLAGVLSRITLREGDGVSVDTVLATLRPLLPPMQDERTLREQQARVDAAQAGVQRGMARAEAARVALQQANNEVQRNEQLAKQGFVSPTQLDNTRLAALAAQKELDAAQSERRVADHELAQTRAALSAVRAPGAGGGRHFELTSPSAGRVLRILQSNESSVAAGAPVIEVGDTSALELVAELLTTDALQARPGSPVRVERWGGDTVLEGRVRRVEPAAFTKVSALGVEEQRVRVVIDLISPPAQWQALGDGFRVSVRIVTRAMDSVQKVPASAVFPLPAGGMALFVIDQGRARQLPVQLGARNASEAWLTQGPKPGTRVIVYPPQALRDGMRVQERRV